MNFRYDINGLRAIAVVAVILFHFNQNWLPGGFIGVDIFFVISGFLMTGIIFSGMQEGKFAVSSFYIARARRIIPPLAIVCVAVILFGFLFVIPKDLSLISKHALSSVLFASNFIYSGENSYFDIGASQKWLLHTWSLSVEWQFYIIYPLILLGLSRTLGLISAKRAVLSGAILGFIYCVYISNTDPTNAFFLLPSRAWEMLAGGVAFLYPMRISGGKQKALEYIGFSAILISCILLKEDYTWPGYLALLPTLGTFLVIQSANEKSIILRNTLAQQIGKYSYSLYLWHWPIIVAVGYLGLEKNPYAMLTTLIILSVLSYHLVEKRRLSKKAIASLAGSAAAVCIACYYTNGFAFRVADEFQLTDAQFHSKYYGGAGYPVNKFYSFGDDEGRLDAIMIGDSFGSQYSKAYEELAKSKKLKFSMLFDYGCLILPDYTMFANGAEDELCSSEYEKLLPQLNNNKDTPVILAFAWSSYKDTTGRKNQTDADKFKTYEDYHEMLRSELARLFRDGGSQRRYYLVGVPQSAQTLAVQCLSQTELLGARLLKSCVTEEPYNAPETNIALAKFASTYPNVHYIDPSAALCSAGKCKVIHDRQPIHSDRGHVSVYGAQIIAPYLIKEVLGK